ncbi:MAG: EAL domain-containing protein [Zoogloeaceae bacterium]|jgi:diguanylate cyclase (GGDEF)-like protein/PAS domain S-box-containing protein|nr:EAL domain-containing protein [Zoogloeaceae bacterium]
MLAFFLFFPFLPAQAATVEYGDAWALPVIFLLLILLAWLARSVLLTRAALEESQKELEGIRQSFSAGPVAVLSWDNEAEWKVTAATQNVTEVLGVSRERLFSPEFVYTELVLPDDLERFVSESHQFVAERRQEQWRQYYRIMDDAGNIRWIRDYTTSEFDANGRLKSLRGYLIDDSASITTNKHIQMLSSVFQNVRECICVTDTTGRILDVNPAFERTTGYSRREAQGENPRILKSGRHDDKFYCEMWSSLLQHHAWQGEIWNRRKNGEVYLELLSITAVCDDEGHIIRYIGVFTDITSFKEQQREIERLAHYDILTGLPNRALLTDRLRVAFAKARRDKGLLAVAYLDLDGFKEVNDVYGHKAGDQLLISVAQRLTAALREVDTVARMGGDEFVLVLCGGCSRSDYLNTLERLLAQLAAPFTLPEATISLSASIGITFYPDDDADPDVLLRHADQSMYRAKRAGRAHFQVFSPEEEQDSIRLQENNARIEYALDRGEFSLYYQPTLDLHTGRIVNMAALLRWQHPSLGLLAYAEFISRLSGTKLELRLGEWVVRTALAELNYWRENGLGIGLTINISHNQLRAPEFLPFLESQLRLYPPLTPGLLELDILASPDLENMTEVARIIASCRQMGILVALGDFGTGYSSLASLRRLPISMLKLDQSFVRGMMDSPEDLSIVEGVINLAGAFKHKVIAEGVESPLHGALLLYMGCDFARGYGICRPMPTRAIADWLREWHPAPEWQMTVHMKQDHQQLPLLLMGMNIRHSSEKLLAYVFASEEERSTLAASDSINGSSAFDRWYRAALSTYEDNPCLPLLKETEIHLRNIARAMRDAIERNQPEEAEVRIDSFIATRDQFMQILQQLLQRTED